MLCNKGLTGAPFRVRVAGKESQYNQRWALQAAEKRSEGRQETSGHDFSRANKANKINAVL
jgi:hypothetical protein